MVFKSILGAICACLTVVSFSANSALVSRLGGLAYYDTDADLTWLADANAAVGSAYDTYSPGSGRMDWFDANAWAAGLDVAGVTGWRLPDTMDVGNDGATYSNIYQGVDYGYNITTHSELSNMFYNVLGNQARIDTNGTYHTELGLTNTGPFSNLQSNIYWSATEYAPSITNAWYFLTTSGYQGYSSNSYAAYAWAVKSGDVSAVPVPGAVWLLGSGLVGLLGFARRQR